MEKQQKKSLYEHLVIPVIILLVCFGALMLTLSLGINGVVTMFISIGVVLGIFMLLMRYNAKTAFYFFYLLLALIIIYALGGWNFVYYIFAALLILLAGWGIYKIGDRFGWWKPASWNK
jgi:hypothetical protein